MYGPLKDLEQAFLPQTCRGILRLSGCAKTIHLYDTSNFYLQQLTQRKHGVSCAPLGTTPLIRLLNSCV